MKVILKENVDNMGYVGDVVEVNRGYARNYLFPRGLAIEYSSGNLKSIEHLKKKEWEKRNREIVEAQQLAEKIDQITLTFQVKAGKDGKLFGSVTHKDIAESLAAKHRIEIDRKKIEHNEPLKKIGDYQVSVRLHKEVNANLNIKIVPEETEKEEKKVNNSADHKAEKTEQ
ncbi:MAG: 50S ribosomal protein L9 [Atribacterota bacterium]